MQYIYTPPDVIFSVRARPKIFLFPRRDITPLRTWVYATTKILICQFFLVFRQDLLLITSRSALEVSTSRKESSPDVDNAEF